MIERLTRVLGEGIGEGGNPGSQVTDLLRVVVVLICNDMERYRIYLFIHYLDKVIGTLPFLVLYLKRPTRAAPIDGGLVVYFEF